MVRILLQTTDALFVFSIHAAAALTSYAFATSLPAMPAAALLPSVLALPFPARLPLRNYTYSPAFPLHTTIATTVLYV